MDNKRGRPSTYSDEVGLRIANHVRHGATLHEAARAEAVPRQTVDGWFTTQPHFAALLAAFQAQAVTDLLGSIHNQADKDWRAAAWLLEKLDPQRFGRRIEIDLKLELEDLSNEELYQIASGSYPRSTVPSTRLIEGTSTEPAAFTDYQPVED